MLRLFLAVNFDGAVREKLAAVQERLLAAGARGRFSRRENLHLTLCFLGETPPERLPSVRRAMDAVSFSPFPLEFETAGRFRRTGGDLWWVGVRPEPGLFRLQRELAERLSKEGFRLESRAFQPHVTLARDVRMAEAPAPKALLPEPFGAVASRVSLMQSERVRGMLAYTELEARRARR